MAKCLQLRRGVEQAQNLFTGEQGEFTMTTDTNELRLHNGTKVGGFRVPTLVAVQYPSAANNYIWYRKYSDGWVEQGGVVLANTGTSGTVILPVAMADTYYTVTANNGNNGANNYFCVNMTNAASTTQISWLKSATNMACSWEVKGMAAA